MPRKTDAEPKQPLANWTVTGEFDLDGEHYQPGDTWTQPRNWVHDDQHFELKGKHAFNYTVRVIGPDNKPRYDNYWMALPVKPVANA